MSLGTGEKRAPRGARAGWFGWVAVGALAGAAAAMSARAGAECAFVVPDPDRAGLALVSVSVDGVEVDGDTLAAYAAYTVTVEATADGVDLQVAEADGELVTVEVWQ